MGSSRDGVPSYTSETIDDPGYGNVWETALKSVTDRNVTNCPFLNPVRMFRFEPGPFLVLRVSNQLQSKLFRLSQP